MSGDKGMKKGDEFRRRLAEYGYGGIASRVELNRVGNPKIGLLRDLSADEMLVVLVAFAEVYDGYPNRPLVDAGIWVRQVALPGVLPVREVQP